MSTGPVGGTEPASRVVLQRLCYCARRFDERRCDGLGARCGETCSWPRNGDSADRPTGAIEEWGCHATKPDVELLVVLRIPLLPHALKFRLQEDADALGVGHVGPQQRQSLVGRQVRQNGLAHCGHMDWEKVTDSRYRSQLVRGLPPAGEDELSLGHATKGDALVCGMRKLVEAVFHLEVRARPAQRPKAQQLQARARQQPARLWLPLDEFALDEECRQSGGGAQWNLELTTELRKSQPVIARAHCRDYVEQTAQVAVSEATTCQTSIQWKAILSSRSGRCQ